MPAIVPAGRFGGHRSVAGIAFPAWRTSSRIRPPCGPCFPTAGTRMPPVPPAASGIGWLRASVARFCDGAAHARRRGYAVDLLGAIDPADLERRAHDATADIVRGRSTVDVMSEVARPVPVGVLMGALRRRPRLRSAGALPVVAGAGALPVAAGAGALPVAAGAGALPVAAGAGALPVAAGAAVAAAARAYQPHTNGDREADAAVATLVEAFGGVADEITAARVGLLVQAYDATAGLIGNAIVGRDEVAAALREDPPVRRTRRVRGGSTVHVDLTANPFGAGPHRCPGREHATAIVAGVVAALRDFRPVAGGIEYEPSPALRIPARLLVTRGPGP